MADLANLAAFYEKAGRSSWTSCVQRNNMLIVAFVRHRRDEHFAYLVDDLVRASTCRFWVFSIGRPARRDLHESLSKFMSYLDPEAVIAVRYSERDRTIWIEFADGLRRAVPWVSLNLMDISPALRPESIRLGRNPDTIELLDAQDEVFDVDAAAIRALVDPKVAKAHFAIAERAALTLGERLRLRREQAGLTQTALAERSGLPQEMISDLERGQHEPRFATLEKYARGLGLSMSDLLSGTTQSG
jgi:DNA-binding XRE family transcriptional regulator